ncbi:MAG: hypothetical protein E7185_09275 [Erysipelotrichaceae bacterium]|nr:hypothetical protein [Erysipelotrichaceae bacterium]
MPNDVSEFETVYSSAENTVLGGENVIRAVKSDKIMQFDENTIVRLKDCDFHNGVIKVKMLSRLLPDAPDFARGFIGIVYRVNENNSEFESFYIRPTNGMTDDPVRKAHGCQYFSYPGYTFAYFREFGITGYEAPIHNKLDEWVELKAVVQNETASFYLNGEEEPVLIVTDMKHGKDARGSVGFFCEIGTEAFFKDLEIEFID